MIDKTHTKLHLLIPLGLVIAVIVLALNTSAPDVNISTTPGQMTETISVSGLGKTTVEPDQAEVYVNIITESASAEEAQQNNADIAESVRNALIREGVDKEDIETSSYYLYPKTSYNRVTGESEIYGYKLTHVLKITTKEVDDTGSFVDAAIDAGANGLQNINFRLSDELRNEAYTDALDKAANVAEGKAEAIAISLSITLGEVSHVSESGASYVPYAYPMMERSFDEGMAAGAPIVISPQDVVVSASISIVYEIN